MEREWISRQTSISGNIIMLCRYLRQKGFKIGPAEEANALIALSCLPIQRQDAFKEALRTTLAKNQYQYTRFFDLYDEFWHQLAQAVDAKVKSEVNVKEQASEAQKKEAQFQSIKDWLNLNPADEEQEMASFSDLEVLTRKNFADLSQEEMELMMRLLQKLARQIAHQKSRLKKKAKRKAGVDLGRTIRASMRQGGEITQLVRSRHKDKKLRLVLLCDVSKSMDLYSRFFVHLIYAFQNSYDKIETFVFSTALHRVTEMLDNLSFSQAFRQISERVPQWSGGTTIGSCLQSFVQGHGHNMLDRKTIVIILSDGWDTGDQAAMKGAMQQLHKQARKVIWLNPLAGSPGFSPEALGMKAAMPYIDTFAPAHNLESLKQVLQNLARRR
jgi:uncharacterized protein with von Willebrand factor type A (vWA) domain